LLLISENVRTIQPLWILQFIKFIKTGLRGTTTTVLSSQILKWYQGHPSIAYLFLVFHLSRRISLLHQFLSSTTEVIYPDLLHIMAQH
jgi:hypothetical protein